MSTAKLNAEQRETVHQMVLDAIKPYGLQPARRGRLIFLLLLSRLQFRDGLLTGLC